MQRFQDVPLGHAQPSKDHHFCELFRGVAVSSLVSLETFLFDLINLKPFGFVHGAPPKIQ